MSAAVMIGVIDFKLLVASATYIDLSRRGKEGAEFDKSLVAISM